MSNTRKHKIATSLFCRLSLFICFCLVIALAPFTGTTSILADNPDIPKVAPMNPAYVEHMQNLQRGQKKAPYGYIPPTIDLSHLKRIPVQAKDKKMIILGASPSSFDWRTYGKVTSVKNQSPCGTCWTFNNISVTESRTWILNLVSSEPDFSEQNLNTCTDLSWTYLIGDRCNGGGNDLIAQDTLTKKGTRLESCQPYNTATINVEACNNSCTTYYRTTNWRYIAPDDSTSAYQTAIKNAIQTYGPVTLAYYADALHLYPGAIYYYPSCPSNANHSVTAVGWDDNLAHPAGGGRGAWLCKNSWGTAWGNDGYFWLCYGSASVSYFGSLQTIKANDPNERIYYWDEAGFVSAAGYGIGDATTAWMANIFTASPGGSLTDVDFWNPSNNTQYTINIYNNGNISSLGSPVATNSGTCSEAGYYSIPLTAPVTLNNGQSFTVAVKITTPGYNYPIPIEMVSAGMCNPPIQTGKCYIKHYDSDTTWLDAASQGWNTCLRVRVASGTVPSAPTLISPADGSNQAGSAISFSWSASGANDYDLYIWSSGGTFYDRWESTNSAVVTGFPQDGRTFYWRVYPRNDYGIGTPSSTFSFINGPAAALPPAPILVSPANGSNQPSSIITFDWNPSTGASNYDLYIWSSGGTFYDQWLSADSAVITGFPQDGRTFYWRVYPKNNLGIGPPSSTFSFINGPATTPPPAPNLTSPGTTFTVKWETVTGATSYLVQVNTNFSFTGTYLFNAVVGNVTSQEVSGLSLGTTYYCRVRAQNAIGWGSWSTVRNFQAN